MPDNNTQNNNRNNNRNENRNNAVDIGRLRVDVTSEITYFPVADAVLCISYKGVRG